MRMVSRPYWSLCCRSSKSIDSIKAPNSFRCLDMRSCLLAGQFVCLHIWCFRSSRCVLVLVQWNRRWSMVWSPWPQEHAASSHRLQSFCAPQLYEDARCVETSCMCGKRRERERWFCLNAFMILFIVKKKMTYFGAILPLQHVCHVCDSTSWNKFIIK